MMDDRLEQEQELLCRERIGQRKAQMRREKERQRRFRRNVKIGIRLLTGGVCVILLVLLIKSFLPKTPESNAQATDSPQNTMEQPGTLGAGEPQKTEDKMAQEHLQDDLEGQQQTGEVAILGESRESGSGGSGVVVDGEETGKIAVGEQEFWAGYEAETTGDTVSAIGDGVTSTYAVFINASTGEIVARREERSRISPASMTKILTVLVAAEHEKNLDEEVTITFEMTDYAYVNDCSVAGFEVGEKVPVRDLFYGTILPSGGEAAMALAIHVAGSEEAFIEMMNQKLEELGLSDTAHFTNCVGLYDEQHYCTTYDMAMILKAALENDFCREVLTARTYQTTVTEEHPEGLLLSNWFLRRIEDKDCGGQVLGAKTGYVNQSGSCAASYGISAEGTPYLCVTANASSSWRCIYDHVTLYSTYGK